MTLYPLVHKSSLGSQLLLSQEARKETLQDSPGQTLSSCTSFPTLAQSCGQGGQAGAGASPQRRTGKPGLLQALQGTELCKEVWLSVKLPQMLRDVKAAMLETCELTGRREVGSGVGGQSR